MKWDDKTEVLHVDKLSIVTGIDVQSVGRSPQMPEALMFTLREKGAEKLSKATEDADGTTRIAVLIDGLVVSAPTVNVRLDKSFIIEGMKNLDEDLDFFCWRIQGKNADEIRRLQMDRKNQQKVSSPSPSVEPEYYSAEEYGLLKNARERAGIYHLDVAPDEDELAKRLAKGMSEKDVRREFGQPTRTPRGSDGMPKSFIYELAPEKRTLEQGMRPDGFEVRFNEEKVDSWGAITTNAPKATKPGRQEKRALSVRFPDFQMDDEKFGMVRWIEELQMVLKDGEKEPLAQDYADLMSMIHSAGILVKEPSTIAANCSVLIILSDKFPEVEDVRKGAVEGKVSFLAVRDSLKPYLHGEKEWPAPNQQK